MSQEKEFTQADLEKATRRVLALSSLRHDITTRINADTAKLGEVNQEWGEACEERNRIYYSLHQGKANV